MIVAGSSEDGARIRILARGNFSLDSGGLFYVLLALGALTLGLAGVLAWKGYWPVLIVAIVQLGLVNWVLIRVWKNTWIFEEIDIDPDQVRIVRQQHRKRKEVFLESAWTTIRMEQPEVSWYPAKLVLRCRNQQVELGAFLTYEEKLRLARHLSSALSEYTAWRKH